MAFEQILSQVLRSVRLSGAVHFYLCPCGEWTSDAAPGMQHFGLTPGLAVPFHIIAEGTCWLKAAGRKIELVEGDIVAFPFATPHQLGRGTNGPAIEPFTKLPPPPWASTPTAHYEGGDDPVRILCGFLFCSVVGFKPLADCIPEILHVSARHDASGWLASTIAQIEREARTETAGSAILDRLTETMFIQMLRQHIDTSSKATKGWLAALADPNIGRCLEAIHEEPTRNWTIEALARFGALSHSALSERFVKQMGVSPMRYVREWRLHLASRALLDSAASIASIGFAAGYGSEAAFNRAFSNVYGTPPAAWRATALKP